MSTRESCCTKQTPYDDAKDLGIIPSKISISPQQFLTEISTTSQLSIAQQYMNSFKVSKITPNQTNQPFKQYQQTVIRNKNTNDTKISVQAYKKSFTNVKCL